MKTRLLAEKPKARDRQPLVLVEWSVEITEVAEIPHKTPSPDLHRNLRYSITSRTPNHRFRNKQNRQQERGFDSSRWGYQTPEATLGFLGATWLLEAASLLPKTFQGPPGARKLPGPRDEFLALIEPSTGA